MDQSIRTAGFVRNGKITPTKAKQLEAITDRPKGRPADPTRPTLTARAKRSAGLSRRCCAGARALPQQVKRVTFVLIHLKATVTEAMKHPRERDADRRSDRCVWRHARARLSRQLDPVLVACQAQACPAPRRPACVVSSVALRIIVDREREIRRSAPGILVGHGRVEQRRRRPSTARPVTFEGEKIDRLSIGEEARRCGRRAVEERSLPRPDDRGQAGHAQRRRRPSPHRPSQAGCARSSASPPTTL